MPELPEVQTIVDDLKAVGVQGGVIAGAEVFWPRTLSGYPVEAFREKIKDRTIARIRRRGKYIVFDFENNSHLLVHLRMSGRLLLKSIGAPRLKHEHIILSLKDGRQLRFHDPRKFGRFYLVRDTEPILGRLGPEPLDPSFHRRDFSHRLKNRCRMIKPLLLDQTFIAGIGNIYADEALWEARIHPHKIASEFTSMEAETLFRAIRKVLRKGLRNLGTSLGSGQSNFFSVAGRHGHNREQLNVFRRQGAACPRCHGTIQRIVVGQRSTHICEKCQKMNIQSKKEKRGNHA